MKTLKEVGLHHVGFIVPDLEKAAERFEKLFGLPAGDAYEFRPGRVWSYGKEVGNYCLKICMVAMDDGSQIELIQPISGEGVHRDFIETGHNGMHHLGFSVDDYDVWHKYFEDNHANFVFESETEDELNGYRRCFYAEDKELGMIYEIKENPYFRNK